MNKDKAPHLLYRRLVGLDFTPPVFMDIIRRHIDWVATAMDAKSDNCGTWLSSFPQIQRGRVRLVIDDLQLVREASGCDEDFATLQSLLTTYLRRRGISSILVESEGGTTEQRIIPAHTVPESFTTVRTWRVEFDTGTRVAIAVEPTQNEFHGVVRELKNIGDDPVVDPDFESYTNLKAGRPEQVPIEIRLLEETDGWRTYCDEEDMFLRLHFVPKARTGEHQNRIVLPLPATGYQSLCDLAQYGNNLIQAETQVLQVDAFWTEKENNLRSLQDYLTREVAAGNQYEQAAETRMTNFRRTLGSTVETEKYSAYSVKCREEVFKIKGWYDQRLSHSEIKDRVPFTWDFGFLLMDDLAWKHAEKQHLDATNSLWEPLIPEHEMPEDANKLTIKDARDKLDFSKEDKPKSQLSWRKFAEACKIVARAESERTGRKRCALALSAENPQALDCLVLEIWLSESLLLLRDLPGAEALSGKWLDCLRKSQDRNVHGLIPLFGEAAMQGSIHQAFEVFLSGDLSTFNSYQNSLLNLVKSSGMALPLYKCWLLLLEMLPFPATGANGGDPDAGRPVAVRHWYKTAAAETQKVTANSTLDPASRIDWVLARLPGCFSIRGDWDLAVGKGSRSMRLAELAMDVLTDEYANRRRLELGVGLPVRALALNDMSMSKLKTGLSRQQHWGVEKIEYGTLKKYFAKSIGANDSAADLANGFHWLWRNDFEGFAYQSDAFKRWLGQLLDWTQKYRVENQNTWIGSGGFFGYDALPYRKSDWLENNNESCKRLKRVLKFKSFSIFAGLCDNLVAELKSATPAKPWSKEVDPEIRTTS